MASPKINMKSSLSLPLASPWVAYLAATWNRFSRH